MSRYYLLIPTVYGEMGEGTIFDRSSHPPVVRRLHFVLDGPPADGLHTSFPCHMASGTLAEQLRGSRLSGFELAEVEVEFNEQYAERHPDTPTPEVLWLKVSGRPLTDDFGVDAHGHLVVSAAAMDVLRHHVTRCMVYDGENPPTPEQITEDVWEEARRTVEASRKRRPQRRR